MLHLNSLSPISIDYSKSASSLAEIIVGNLEYENDELDDKNVENSWMISALGG